MPVACKPKHDYQQGLLGMGKEGGCRCWCTHALGGATVCKEASAVGSCSARGGGYVRAIEGAQEITFKSWHTEPQIP